MRFSNNLIAVIDIGSNSVRLVIYDELKRVPVPVFNEKKLCALASGMEKTGKLNATGLKYTKIVIARFIQLAKLMKVSNISILATSAVRDAKDGQDFVKFIETTHNIKVNICSGEEEAKFAAYGVISSIMEVNGVVGDLGGGSLEFSSIKSNSIDNEVSFPLGPLRLKSISRDFKTMETYVKEYFAKYPLRELLQNKTFYAVGGVFRALAKLHMVRKSYPIRVVHNYKVSARDLMTTLSLLPEIKTDRLEKFYGISEKRAVLFPYVNLVLQNIINIGKPKDIVFCATGIREGFLYSSLEEKIKSSDPLIAGAQDLCQAGDSAFEYGIELCKWCFHIIQHEDHIPERIVLSACILSDISYRESSEYRGEISFNKIIDSSLFGLTHEERVFIATSVSYRYGKMLKQSIIDDIISQILTTKKLKYAKALGALMRLGRVISGSRTGILPLTSIHIEENNLILSAQKDIKDLITEEVEKRLTSLSKLLHMHPVIKVGIVL